MLSYATHGRNCSRPSSSCPQPQDEQNARHQNIRRPAFACEAIELGGGISSRLFSGSGALIRNRRIVRTVTYGTDRSSETRLYTVIVGLVDEAGGSRPTWRNSFHAPGRCRATGRGRRPAGERAKANEQDLRHRRPAWSLRS